jgi:hypothetical protein
MGRLLTGLLVVGLAFSAEAAPRRLEADSPAAAQPVQKVQPGSRRIVQGTVAAIDLSAGLVTVDADGKPLEINALPRQLSKLKPGDLVSLDYKNYDGLRWLRLQQKESPGGLGVGGAGEDPERDAFGQYGSASGYVDRVDKRAGRLFVRGLAFRSHPELLDSVLPGQFVTVDYAEIGGIAWTERITAASGDSGAGEPDGG